MRCILRDEIKKASEAISTGLQTIEVTPGLRMTRDCDALFDAKAKFTAECPPAISLDSEGRVGARGDRTYKYCSLSAVLEVCNPILGKHGLTFSQVYLGETLVNVLSHKSGQWMSATVDIEGFTLPFPGASVIDAKARGAGITYARRYSALAFLGISADADDNEDSISTGGTTRAAVTPKSSGGTPPPPPAPAKKSAPTGQDADNSFFGDEESGSYSCWFANVEKIRESAPDAARPWTLYAARTISGEEFSTFSDDNAQSLRDAAEQKLPVEVRWTRKDRGQYRSYQIDELLIHSGETEVPESVGGESMEVEVVSVKKDGKVAAVSTSRGRFGAEDPYVVEEVEKRIHALARITFASTPRGRLMTSAVPVDDAAEGFLQ